MTSDFRSNLKSFKRKFNIILLVYSLMIGCSEAGLKFNIVLVLIYLPTTGPRLLQTFKESSSFPVLTAKNSLSLSSALSPLLKHKAPATRLMDADIQWALFSCAERIEKLLPNK